MAGMGSRFSSAGYKDPKPFIKAFGMTLIEIVLKNLDIKDANFILIARSEHIADYHVDVDKIKRKYGVTFITINHITDGAVCTVLHAHKLINNDTPLLLANSDQYIDCNVQDFIDDSESRSLDGSIMTFTNPDMDPKWSYVKLNNLGLVDYVEEKKPISSFASVGLYYFSKGRFFVDAAIDMILARDKINNEFYTCPTYNYMLLDKKKIGIFNIDENQMHGLGTPDDLNNFIARKKCL